MKFEEALKAMREGKKVRRESNPEYVFGLDKTSLWYSYNGGKWYWKDVIGLHQDDILAEDWEVVNEC